MFGSSVLSIRSPCQGKPLHVQDAGHMNPSSKFGVRVQQSFRLALRVLCREPATRGGSRIIVGPLGAHTLHFHCWCACVEVFQNVELSWSRCRARLTILSHVNRLADHGEGACIRGKRTTALRL